MRTRSSDPSCLVRNAECAFVALERRLGDAVFLYHAVPSRGRTVMSFWKTMPLSRHGWPRGVEAAANGDRGSHLRLPSSMHSGSRVWTTPAMKFEQHRRMFRIIHVAIRILHSPSPARIESGESKFGAMAWREGPNPVAVLGANANRRPTV